MNCSTAAPTRVPQASSCGPRLDYAMPDEAMNHQDRRMADAALRPHRRSAHWRGCLAAVKTPEKIAL